MKPGFGKRPLSFLHAFINIAGREGRRCVRAEHPSCLTWLLAFGFWLLAFDVYGTMIDTHGMFDLLQQIDGTEQAPSFALLWPERQLEYTLRRSMMNHYEPSRSARLSHWITESLHWMFRSHRSSKLR
jgi:hypothetical protein